MPLTAAGVSRALPLPLNSADYRGRAAFLVPCGLLLEALSSAILLHHSLSPAEKETKGKKEAGASERPELPSLLVSTD